jgi:chemotaxis protein histidine kinase CheA
MHLDDLLQVMREEFASAAADVDAELMDWLAGDPASAAAHAEPIAALLDRLARTSRMIALDGQAGALEMLRDTANVLAMVDEESMGQGLGWMAAWRSAIEPCFEQPGAAAPIDALIDFLRASPMAPSDEACESLRALLAQAPALPSGGDALAPLPPATAEDVSLALPEDLDQGLYDTFLAEAPDQLARLGDCARALVRDTVPAHQLVEAQRVAHTFKGSGNIIGLRGVARLAHRIEDLLDFTVEQDGRLPGPMAQDLNLAVATLDQMVYALRGEEQAPADAQARIQAVLDWVNAIRDGSWAERAEEHGQLASIEPTVPPMDADALARPGEVDLSGSAAASGAPPPRETDGAAATEAQLRVGVSRLDLLVRRAGQSLVQGGRLKEHLRLLEDRLTAIEANNQIMRARMSELEVALGRQGVTLEERAQVEGGAFDPLEMDRYNDLHALSRFVTELVADELELTRSARAQARQATAALREHGQGLKDQHRDLLGARLLPFRQIAGRLRRNVSQTAAATGKLARLEIEGEQVQLDSDVLDRLTEPLLHLLRNAVDHGIEPPEERTLYGKPDEGVVTLRIARDGQTVRIECHDDGRGLDLAAIAAKAAGLGLFDPTKEPDGDALMRMILLPGFSTREEVTEVSGRGVGMDVVAARVRALKGHISIDSQPLEGTRFTLRVPATTGSVHALVVSVAGEQVALPTEAVVMALAAGQGHVRDGRLQYLEHDLRCVALADWLGLPAPDTPITTEMPVVLVRVLDEVVALRVDAVIDARELILQDVGQMLWRVRGVGGGALRPDGRVMFVLDPDRLETGRGVTMSRAAVAQLRRRATAQRKRVLVVDDALSVRKALAQLLGDAGYHVEQARDGFEALDALQREAADIVLTDLEMPNLNGLDLTRRLRQQDGTRDTPVVMITSRSSDKHRASATAAGVTHYLTKPYTDNALLEKVRSLVAA